MPENEDVGDDLDQLLGGSQLVFGAVQLELGPEHPQGVWLVGVVVIRLGLKYVAVGVASGTQVDQVIDGLVQQLIAELVVLGQVGDSEGHQRSTEG